MRFVRAIASTGKMRLIFPTLNNASFIFPTGSSQFKKLPVPTHEYLKIIDKLCVIQDNIEEFLQVPVEGLTDADVRATNGLVNIIERGKRIVKFKEMTGEFEKQFLEAILNIHRRGELINLGITDDKSHVELLRQKLATGRRTRYLTGKIEMPTVELEQAIAKLVPDEFLPIKFVNAEVIEIFPDWYIREAQRLSQHLVDDFGVESVYLFGSLAWSDIHTPETDIDLAVSGLPSERFLEAVGYLERASKFPVDLVNLESVPDHLRQRILAEGKKLNERAAVTAVSG
jgi:predicted nucleotidyltransferase